MARIIAGNIQKLIWSGRLCMSLRLDEPPYV
jgi:hypothetical protein